MKPYYEDDAVTIYHGDCREILPWLQADAVVTDPPYGIAYKGGQGGSLIHSKRARKSQRVAGDQQPFDPRDLLRFEHVALFGAQHYYDRLPAGGTFHVWDKRGDYKPVHTADFDTVWLNRKEIGRIQRCVWRGLCREVEHNDPILHPTQKPLRIMEWVLRMFPAGTLTIDPYMGSGTTLRAAKDLNRKAIGIELEERYCEIAARRCAQDVLDLGSAA
jgi:DNA modification methylase